MENLFWIGFIGAIIAGLFAVTQAKKVMSYSEGNERMQSCHRHGVLVVPLRTGKWPLGLF